jgi:serine/threonine protein kinase
LPSIPHSSVESRSSLFPLNYRRQTESATVRPGTKATSALNHPNIVRFYDFGVSDFGQFLVMELVEGRSLNSLASRPLETTTVGEIGKQVAIALEATHATGLVDVLREPLPIRILLVLQGVPASIAPLGKAGSRRSLLPSGTSFPKTTVLS